MTSEQEHHHNYHRPVLLDAVLDNLAPQPGERYLDLTAGYGGHASAIMGVARLSEAVLVDRDKRAIEVLKQLDLPGSKLINSDFLSAAQQLREENKRFDMILVDLGVSSPQLDNPSRGFSFRADGPLDMRMDQGNDSLQSAADLINTIDPEELTALIKEYGQEPHARRITAAIVAARPLTGTKQLADVIEQAIPRRPSFGRTPVHPATRTFQAIRIAVNDELKQIEQTLPLLPDLLNEGGRVAIISFHSLEDRMVKQFFKEQSRYAYDSTLELLTKKPISGATEDSFHARSRSAKLRVAVKIKTKERSTHHANRGKNEPLSNL